MPKQKPGKSRQNYETPDDLIEAVVQKYGPIVFDLAATKANAKAEKYFNSKQNSFTYNWAQCGPGNLWLNPPFANIDPWAEKCKETLYYLHQMTLTTRIFLLTPASVGSNWFAEHVWGRAAVVALSPRLTFKGEKDPYPKDCMLSVFGLTPGFEVWRWK